MPRSDAISPDFLDESVVNVVREDGSLDPASDPKISDELVVAIYSEMFRTRRVDERFALLVRQGTIAAHASSVGEEAAIVGAAAALRAQDWVFPGDRDLGAALVRGASLDAYANHIFGNAGDALKGHPEPDRFAARSARFASMGYANGAHLTHAVGFAWGAKVRRDDVVTLAMFGEAAVFAGEFHNALNFAGVFKVPAVLFCRNAHADDRVADRAVAYGLPHVTCDGGDALAVFKVTRDAVARAAAGAGSTLVEARLVPRGVDGVGRRHEPLARLRLHLDARGLWSASKQAELEARVEAEITKAIAAAENKPLPDIATLFEDVYQGTSWHLDEQLETLRRANATCR